MKSISALIVITALLTSCGYGESPQKPSVKLGPEMSVPSVEELPGVQIYMDNCAVCHGRDGDAGIGGAANLQLTQLDSLGLHQVIKNGRNSMPAFQGSLKDEEIGQIIAFFNQYKDY